MSSTDRQMVRIGNNNPPYGNNYPSYGNNSQAMANRSVEQGFHIAGGNIKNYFVASTQKQGEHSRDMSNTIQASTVSIFQGFQNNMNTLQKNAESNERERNKIFEERIAALKRNESNPEQVKSTLTLLNEIENDTTKQSKFAISTQLVAVNDQVSFTVAKAGDEVKRIQELRLYDLQIAQQLLKGGLDEIKQLIKITESWNQGMYNLWMEARNIAFQQEQKALDTKYKQEQLAMEIKFRNEQRAKQEKHQNSEIALKSANDRQLALVDRQHHNDMHAIQKKQDLALASAQHQHSLQIANAESNHRISRDQSILNHNQALAIAQQNHQIDQDAQRLAAQIARLNREQISNLAQIELQKKNEIEIAKKNLDNVIAREKRKSDDDRLATATYVEQKKQCLKDYQAELRRVTQLCENSWGGYHIIDQSPIFDDANKKILNYGRVDYNK